jgi:hypothetical protein
MKLRFHSNSLRLRLSQPEVARLAESGRVEENVEFAPGHVLSYAIESRPVDGISAVFDGGRIEVIVPSELTRQWIESDEAGIESAYGTLKVLIEKDFQCLHRQSHEDAEAFPNPLMDKF